MFADRRIEDLAEVCLEASERAFFVRPHQSRVARHISGEDRGETAGRGHGEEPILLRAMKRRDDTP
jgi:hypothetical protein